MKISKVTPLVLGTPWRNITFLRVDTDEGLVGYGEARAVNRTDSVNGYLEEAVPRYVLGQDPFDIEYLIQRLFREDYARAGETTSRGHSRRLRTPASGATRPVGRSGPAAASQRSGWRPGYGLGWNCSWTAFNLARSTCV